MRRLIYAPAVLLMAGPCFAHRLDEYLQATLLSVEKERVRVQITLTPGVAVLPVILARLDADHDGMISPEEQRAYTAAVLRDLSIAAEGRRLMPQTISTRYPAMEEMREGRGEIRIEFEVSLPAGGRARRFTIENRHLRGVSAYQVNALVPRDRDIEVKGQKRSYTQSEYELDYERADAGSSWQYAGLLGFTAALVLTRLGVARVRRLNNI